MAQTHIIFTDGACSGNPGPGGWGAVVHTINRLVIELGGAAKPTTNNRMELLGTIRALEELAALPGAVVVHTDSTYVIQGITSWIHGWRKKGWVTAEGKAVVNRDLWEELAAVIAARKEKHGAGSALHWNAVPGHAGIPGNERCDEIAVAYSLGQNIDLYQGPRSEYDVDLEMLTPDPKMLAAKKARKKNKKAPVKGSYYLSVVGGRKERHETWAQCEARVKGVAGAKFKRVANAVEEAEALKKWGR